ncbi:putative rho GTPase-activating protein 19 [Apostichopus japonicus]|uniref:Putative rho GTPase-activating protein 19 n=1 Tax=Stichopus japonicus TaxID=307972 RepID=A0A2G8JGE4_STIJA|nr:putative rho GTPase-activating protein 19 [Apostichopus japonicus]
MSSENLCNPLLYMEIMKRKYPETFAEWCCTELSHVLDFSGAENIGQVLLGNVDVRHGKMITRKFSRKKKHTPDSPTGIFGSPLNDAGFCYARQLIEHLKKAINHEGLFRIPGNSGRQQKLKNRINSREVIDLDSDEFTTNDIACVLKTFLGDLPEPLLTDRQYHAHELLELLKSIADNDEMNKMSAFNLGVIFAPHVLWPRYDESDSSRVSCPQQSTVQVKGQKDHTQAALAQLYSNVQAMPEGPKKRRLMKQKQVSTPFHHKKRRLAPPPPEDNGVARQKFQMEKKLCRELVIQLSRPPRPKSRKPSDQENRPSPYTDQSDIKGCSVVLNQLDNMETSSPAVNNYCKVKIIFLYSYCISSVSNSSYGLCCDSFVSDYCYSVSTSQESNNNHKGKNYGKRPVPLPRSTSSPLSSSSMSNVVHPVPIPRKMPLMEGTPPSPIPRTRRAWSQHATSLEGLQQQTDV